MKITTYKPSGIDTGELATFIYQVRHAELDRRNITPHELGQRLTTEWKFLNYVLAQSNGELIGCALLYRLANSDLIEINPGSILGSHPLVSPGYDQEAVAAALLEGAKHFVLQEGFNALYIDIPWDPDGAQEPYNEYRERYGEQGFEVIQQVRAMRVSLPTKIPATTLPSDMVMSHIETVDAGELYECHHASYLQSEVQYYFQMDDQERRADFERIFTPNVKASSASLVLTRQGQIIGYIMHFSEGEFSEVMSLAVHPDYRGQGLGMLLMCECMRRATEQGNTIIHLIVDIKNEAAVALYRRCGFKDVGGNMTFKWKA
jgi:ribosomal protein S18 acetylase RimI-like enzyme